MVVKTERIAAANSNRVAVPAVREECSVCKKPRQGVTAPWGITRACGSDACLLVAQATDKGIKSIKSAVARLPEKPLQKSTFPQYAGAGIAYLGSGKWAVGFMDNDNIDDRTWFRDVTIAQALDILAENAKFCVRQEESSIFGR